ncbi:hypothetical protein RHMOL_Rhmol06G0283000 [Rhododendron molle]|uniref:Uncharacterized protein n=1 Tax=Rhododendron molle TaxID=49168 RepID=A0ACC0NJ84_RHOML|nr:hypothetical protein RHMOL_Rhmol06G0283000 [Rhododendron molle]
MGKSHIRTEISSIEGWVLPPVGKLKLNTDGSFDLNAKAVDDKDSIMASIPADLREKGGLKTLLECIKDKDPDKVSVGLASSLNDVAQLEQLQAPRLSFLLPQQYSKYPRLTGRGIVELVIEKGEGATFSPEAGGCFTWIFSTIDCEELFQTGKFRRSTGLTMGVKLSCINQAILSDSKNSGYSVPLEIMPSGQFESLYKTTLKCAGKALHFVKLPMPMCRYTTVGREILPEIKTGDLIRFAKLVEGQDRLRSTRTSSLTGIATAVAVIIYYILRDHQSILRDPTKPNENLTMDYRRRLPRRRLHHHCRAPETDSTHRRPPLEIKINGEVVRNRPLQIDAAHNPKLFSVINHDDRPPPPLRIAPPPHRMPRPVRGGA